MSCRSRWFEYLDAADIAPLGKDRPALIGHHVNAAAGGSGSIFPGSPGEHGDHRRHPANATSLSLRPG